MPLFVAEFQFRYNKCENADIWGKAIKLMTLRPNWIAIALPASSSIARRDVKTCSTSKIRMLTVTFHLALAEPIMGLRENGVGVM
jgi:hypothetical protein